MPGARNCPIPAAARWARQPWSEPRIGRPIGSAPRWWKPPTKATLQGFVAEHAAPDALVYTDEAAAYQGLPHHEAVKHGVAEYVRGQAHTNGMESFWSMLKRAHAGTFHKLSPKHLNRYVQEFAGRHNVRVLDTLDQMATLAAGMGGKRLMYRQLIADNGLDSGARL